MPTIEQEMRQSRKAAGEISLTPEQRSLIRQATRSNADFMRRLRDRDRRRIDNPDGTHSTHLLGWATDDQNRAIERQDTLMTTPELADWFTRNYKTYFPVE